MFTSPFAFLCNALIILAMMSFSLLLRRRIFGLSIIAIMWLGFGVANYVLLSNRVTPFGAPDFKNMEDAVAIMGKYLNTFTYILVISVFLVAVFGIALIWIKVPKVLGKVKYLKNIIIIGITVFVTFIVLNIALLTGSLSTKLPELSTSYLKYGFVYCFSNSVVNTGVNKPSGYSKDKIDDIVNPSDETTVNPNTNQQATTPAAHDPGTDDPVDKPVKEAKKKPNIIIVQLESFFDITEVKDLKFSEDPIPNYHKLMKKWASGHLTMPVVGAGTANSEFEVLTSMNLSDFGPGEYPYKTVLKTANCESISYNLKEYGYVAHAIHNNTGGFYGRNKVFSQLGFDDFTSVEYMNNITRTPMGWAKDEVLVEEINKALDATKQRDFVYTISVQGHGSYPASGEYDTEIKITSDNEDQSRLNAMEYYTQQIHEMDQFVADLIKAIDKRGEESIVVFYGDHLPSFGLSDADVETGSIYKTPYLIWNNCKVNYVKEDLEAFQLQPKILKALDMDAGVINKFHQENKGNEEYLNGLQNLEYDILYGDLLVYNGINPYKPTNLKMGIDEIKITKITKEITAESSPFEKAMKFANDIKRVQNGEDVEILDKHFFSINPNKIWNSWIDIAASANSKEGYVTVKGNNFTPYSKVFVNGDYFNDTEFIDSETLRIYYPELKGADSFVVSQAHSETNVLSSSKEALYYGE